MRCSKSCESKRKVYSNTIPPQQMRKISNNQTLHLKQPEKEEQTKAIIIRKKERKKLKQK